MKFPFSCGWQQGDGHPLRIVHYALVFQALLALVIIVLVIYSFLNIGWWTQKEHAVINACLIAAATIVFVLPIQIVTGYVRPIDSDWNRRIKTGLGTLWALTLIICYGLAGAAMLSKPGKDFRKAFDEPPYGTWWTATALVFSQCIISAYRAYRIVLYFFKPGRNNGDDQTEMDEYPLTDNTSHAPASSTRISSQAGGATARSSQNSTRFSLNPFQIPSKGSEQQERAEETARPSDRRHLSERAKGKQRESQGDGVKGFDDGLAFVDVGSSTWSAV